MFLWRTLAAAVLLCTAAPLQAYAQEVFYVRAGANGTGTGADWANALPSLPPALVRGAVYYVADGVYGSYAFDDPAAGSTPITIRKAVAGDHGTDVGWQATYGDGSADWTSWAIRTSDWVFDGQRGRWAPDLPAHEPYGFRVRVKTTKRGHKLIKIGNYNSYISNVTIRHVEAGFENTPFVATEWGLDQDIVYSWGHDITLTSVWLHDAGRVNIYAGEGSNNHTYEYSVLERNGQSNAAGMGTEHSELYAGEGGENHTFRHNVIRDWRSTGGLNLHDNNGTPPNFTNWRAYGNVFTTTGYFSTAGDANGVLNGLSDTANATVYVYNNTFVNIPYGCSVLTMGHYVTGVVRNNVFVNCRRTKTGAMIGGTLRTHNLYFQSGSQNEENAEISVEDPLIDSNAGNYRLRKATLPGQPLDATFANDPLGVLRGSDGVWDRGAFEYATTLPPAPPTDLRVQP